MFEAGYPWNEECSIATASDKAMSDSAARLSVSFARCLGTEDGKRVIQHLRGLTLERALGPGAPDALLRYLEGQRQLVGYICALVERGRTAPPPDHSDPGLPHVAHLQEFGS